MRRNINTCPCRRFYLALIDCFAFYCSSDCTKIGLRSHSSSPPQRHSILYNNACALIIGQKTCVLSCSYVNSQTISDKKWEQSSRKTLSKVRVLCLYSSFRFTRLCILAFTCRLDDTNCAYSVLLFVLFVLKCFLPNIY